MKDYRKIITGIQEELNSIVSKYKGTPYKDFPYSEMCFQSATEDFAETDLYSCVITQDGVNVKFYVETLPLDGKIINIDISICDIITNGTIIDCIDFNYIPNPVEYAIKKLEGENK